ncbi:MAG: HAMP domain-containing sensor histidine kinase, partial [Polyangiaceae bacterium]
MMLRRFTVSRRITLAVLLGLLGSVLLVVLFSAAFWRVTRLRKPTSDALMFPTTALLAEAASDDALRTRAIEALKLHSPGCRYVFYSERGELLATTMADPFEPLANIPGDWGATESIELPTKRHPRVEVIPVVNSSGMRFYALNELEDRPAPPPLSWWFWLSCAIPVGFFGLVSLLLARSITLPLDRIVMVSRALADGQLSAKVGYIGRDELGVLGSALDLMTERVAGLLRGRLELLALVSHELRTPLSRMRVALDTAVEGDIDRARQTLSSIAVDLAELERLLGDTLAYSRIEIEGERQAGTPLELDEVDPTPLLQDAAARFHASWPDRALQLDLQNDLPLLDGDRILLARVLLNLLDNAAKYSPVEQPVHLRASSSDGVLSLEVEDHGPGIDEADRERIFEPFFRSRAAVSHA